MERSKYNRGGGAGRGRGGDRSASGVGRDGSGGRGGSGERAGNNYQQYHRQYQTGGGDGGRRRGRGGRDGTWMGPNPSPAQPWGYQGSQGRNQRPQFAMGQGVGATGGTGIWSGGPPHVAGRGSSAPAVGGGAGAGQAPRKICPCSCSCPCSCLLCSPCCLSGRNGDALSSLIFIINFFHIIIVFICGFIGP